MIIKSFIPVPDIVGCMACSIKRKKKKKPKLRDMRLFDGPEMQLFLWALLLNRIEMAKIFWSMLPRNKIGKSEIMVLNFLHSFYWLKFVLHVIYSILFTIDVVKIRTTQLTLMNDE